MRRTLAISLGCVGVSACSLLSPYGANDPAPVTAPGDAAAVDRNDTGSKGFVTASDASGGSTDGGSRHAVRCPRDSGDCTQGQTVCCAASEGPPPPDQKSYSCVPTEQCGLPGIRVPCQGGADCAAEGKPGTVCCYVRSSVVTMVAFACVPPGECKGFSVVVCDSRLSECPVDQYCLPEATGYHPEISICQPLP